jgi:DNA-binding MarR family transcriptional regulator
MFKMSTQPGHPSRDELLKRLDETLRKITAQSVLISDLVATRVGLNSTDLECLDLLYLAGVTTAGTLAKRTGLTSGATTAVIDRLERAGFVRRRRDAGDRRKVLVEVLSAGAGRIAPLYAGLAAQLEELNREYSDRQLTVVVEYLSRAMDLGAHHVAWLQTQPVPARRPAGSRASGRPQRPATPQARRGGRAAGNGAAAAERH